MALARDDDMIVDADVEPLARVDDLAGDVDILPAGRWVAGRVIVHLPGVPKNIFYNQDVMAITGGRGAVNWGM